jgi:hypothetical protein
VVPPRRTSNSTRDFGDQIIKLVNIRLGTGKCNKRCALSADMHIGPKFGIFFRLAQNLACHRGGVTFAE